MNNSQKITQATLRSHSTSFRSGHLTAIAMLDKIEKKAKNHKRAKTKTKGLYRSVTTS